MVATRTDPGLFWQPIVHVDDLAVSVAFYEQLGGAIIHGGLDAEWVLMQLGSVQIGLSSRPPDTARGEGPVELAFGTAMPLAQLEQQLHQAGFGVCEVGTDRDFGEQLRVRTPEGLLIKINQREPDC